MTSDLTRILHTKMTNDPTKIPKLKTITLLQTANRHFFQIPEDLSFREKLLFRNFYDFCHVISSHHAYYWQSQLIESFLTNPNDFGKEQFLHYLKKIFLIILPFPINQILIDNLQNIDISFTDIDFYDKYYTKIYSTKHILLQPH